ncbi:MAG: HD domain-containing phosphohydrolase, partial [Chloroflexota bacterium]
KAAVGIPILADNTVVAVMDFFLREAQQQDERMVDLVSAVAAQLGTAFQRRQAEDGLRRRREELEALAQVSSALRQVQTRDAMLPLLVEQAMQVLHADAGALILLEDETLAFAAVRGPAKPLQGRRHPPGDDPLWEVVRNGQPLFIPDVTEQGEFTGREICQLLMSGLKACACVPLKAAEATIGLLHLACKSPRVVTEDEIRMLASIAEMAGNALHRTALHEQVVQDAMVLAQAYDATLEGWARALELRDKETEGHTQRVTEITLQLARAMGMGEDELVHIRRGALLHDIGKMGIPDSILHKPDKLTDEEWAIMRQHPQYALDMLAPIDYLRPALDIPGCHHERWDDTGYPRGLKGEQIPLAARLFAVVDVWDALRSDRPYRQGWPEEKVREHIRTSAGTHFDPEVVELFLKVMSEDTKGTG